MCSQFLGLVNSCIIGLVVASHDPQDTLLDQRVVLVPSRGRKDGPDAPEEECVSHCTPKIQTSRPGATFHSIIDSSGNEIMEAMWKYLRPGGRLVVYGVWVVSAGAQLN